LSDQPLPYRTGNVAVIPVSSQACMMWIVLANALGTASGHADDEKLNGLGRSLQEMPVT
jgi:hypothetical protein